MKLAKYFYRDVYLTDIFVQHHAWQLRSKW